MVLELVLKAISYLLVGIGVVLAVSLLVVILVISLASER